MTTEVRMFSGHRMASDPVTRDDYCLDCGWNGLGQIRECRPGTPRCDTAGCHNPANVLETIGGEVFAYCGTCRADLRAAVARCPWCETPVRADQRLTEWRGNLWHDGCLADQHKAAYEVEP